MNKLGQFDGALQMFVEGTREPDMRWLEFVRWLVEHGGLEHDVAGPPSESYAPGIGEPTVPDAAPELDGRLAALGRQGHSSFGGTVE
jgi:hypothetical protein